MIRKIIIVVISLILLTPVPMRYKDGGTVCYQAILYSVTNYHAMRTVEEFDIGIEIKTFGITIYENTTFSNNK